LSAERVNAVSAVERAEPVAAAATAAAAPAARPDVAGKFFRVGGQKQYVRGVTYGPFRPADDGVAYDRARVENDFPRIVAAGANTVRLYTAPPEWLLDLAADHGLSVLAGTAWEQHVAFLDDARRARAIATRVARELDACAGHPALLAWTIGNEIPAPVARWHGAARVAHFLSRLYDAAKAADPGALVTYVNYPSTEYLELDFLDFVCFNVFLESPVSFERYLHRLQNIADERPLVLTEIGLDSGTHGERAQADSIYWQIRAAFHAGCAGAFVFAWTDEWHRGGHDVEDWQFGLTDRDRRPKPSLAAARSAFHVPLVTPSPAPRVSVVVCSYNGAATLAETCDAATRLDYPDYEVILVDDGSTDRTPEIAREYGVRVISTENRGLSAARNTGLEAATGEIVAYLDDDAAPDPHWLQYLVQPFLETGCVAAGGPNIPVPGDGLVADAVAAAPGNPTHVLVSDQEAEHVPGCNAAFRADALREVGGFDDQFRVAGDDVDVCWRLQDRGGRIAFAPAAMVWHHRRSSIRAYLKQQHSYGRAEAMLERKWPERYTAGGHVTWRGRIYGGTAPKPAAGPLRWRVYHGVWGSAPFQSLYAPRRGELNTVLLMPEAYLAVGFITVLVALGAVWAPLFLLAPVLILAAGALAVGAISAVMGARFPTPGLTTRGRIARQGVTAFLQLAQPLLRLEGRMREGLTPWRRRGDRGRTLPIGRSLARWSEDWVDPNARVRSLETVLVDRGAVVRRGSDFDTWDLEVRGGTLAGARVWTLVEEHGEGRQLARYRCRPTWSRPALAFVALLAVLDVAAALDGAVAAAVILGLLTAALAVRVASEASSAMAAAVSAVDVAESRAAPAE